MRILAIAALSLISCSHTIRPTVEQSEIMATVRLISETGSCSGVVVGPHSILSAAHCAGKWIVARDYLDQLMCPVNQVKIDVDADLLLIHTDCSLFVRAPIAPLEPLMGTRVQVTGFPLGVEFPVLTDGWLTTVTQEDSIANNKQVLSAPTIGGNSGGPVWFNGQVVGIVSCGVAKYHHINFAVRQRTIQEFLNGQQL